MKKLEIYYDQGLKASIYSNTLSDNPYHIKNTEVVELIQKSYLEEILNVSDGLDKKDAKIIFDGCELVIKDYEQIFKNKALYDLFDPLFSNAKEFLEKRELEKTNKRKVVRKNKYASRILAVGLSLAALATTAIGIKAMDSNKKNDVIKERKIIYAPEFDYTPTKSFEYSPIDNVFELKEVANDSDTKSVEDINNIAEQNTDDTLEIEKDYNVQNIEENVDSVITIDYEDDTLNPDITYVKEKYGDMIEKYSKMYGLDPNIMIAIAVGESSGRHEKYLEGHAAIGLMQIERTLDGENLKAYNFETNEWERSVLKIDELKDVEKNFIAACKMFQMNLRYWNYNPLLAVQSYNMGFGNMKSILGAYESDTGLTREDVENNVSDTGWMNYRYVVAKLKKQGSEHYLEHVLSRCGTDYEITVMTPDGKEVKTHVSNQIQKKI